MNCDSVLTVDDDDVMSEEYVHRLIPPEVIVRCSVEQYLKRTSLPRVHTHGVFLRVGERLEAVNEEGFTNPPILVEMWLSHRCVVVEEIWRVIYVGVIVGVQ